MAVLLHGFRSELLASESGEDEWPTLPDYRTVVFGIKMIAPPGGFANQADAQAALDLMELDWTQEQCPVPTDEDPPMPPNFVPTPPPPANQLAPIDIPGIAPDPLLNLKQLSDTGVVNQAFRNPIWMGTTTITFDAHVVQIPGSTKFGVEGVITVHFNYYDGEVPSFPEGTDPGSAV